MSGAVAFTHVYILVSIPVLLALLAVLLIVYWGRWQAYKVGLTTPSQKDKSKSVAEAKGRR